MTEIGVVWLVDTDPPSEVGGGRGFYPASSRDDPPDEAVMRARLDAVREAVLAEAGGNAVLTLHTSPRYRGHFFREPYISVWRRFVDDGVGLALHPHEDRADGSSLYDDLAHLNAVIVAAVARARAAGLPLQAFRSGGFSFHPRLPSLLRRVGLDLDLSAAPGLTDAARCVDWPPGEAAAGLVADRDGGGVLEVPLGWDRKGTDLARHYLFNERTDLAGLQRVWDGLRRAADRNEAPRVVNFLTHGFGLVRSDWRRQAADFLRFIAAHGGRIVNAAEAAECLDCQREPRSARAVGA